MLMTVDDIGSSLDPPSHPTIHALPSMRTSLNLYFLLICCTVFIRKINLSVYREGRGIGRAVRNIINIFIPKPLKVEISLSMAPEHVLKLASCVIGYFVNAVLSGSLLFLSLLNITLIIICDCSIINPGPNSLSIVYNNIHGPTEHFKIVFEISYLFDSVE